MLRIVPDGRVRTPLKFGGVKRFTFAIGLSPGLGF
jgi:hypothetical protein